MGVQKSLTSGSSVFAKSEKITHLNFKASDHTVWGEVHVQRVNNLVQKWKRELLINSEGFN